MQPFKILFDCQSPLRCRFKNAPLVGGLLLLLVASVLVTPVAMAEEFPAGSVPEQGAVQKTYNDQPFEYQAKLLSEKEEYRVFRVTYPSPIVTEYEQNNTVPADYYLPKGIKPGERRPAVVCLHILHGRFELVTMVCSSLAARGVPAIMIKLPYYGEREIPGGFSTLRRQGDLFSQGMLQGLEDIRRTVDFLESRPEVDPKRLGVTGLSLGAIVSARVAADESRFSKVVIVFGGGDLPYIIDNAKETRTIKEYLEKLSPEELEKYKEKIRQIDPLTYAEKLRERAKKGNVWMFNGSVDETITPYSARKLAAAIGIEDQIRWYEGVGHYTFFDVLPDMLKQTVEFFADDVPTSGETLAEEKPAEDAVPAADVLVNDLFEQIHKVIAVEPKSDCYHEIELNVESGPEGEKSWKGRLHYVRGAGEKFKLEVQLDEPMKVQLSMGNGEFPWLASPEKGVVFCGTQEQEEKTPATLAGPLDGVKAEYLKNWGMVKGAISVIAMSPSLLERLALIEELTVAPDAQEETKRRIRVKPQRGEYGDLVLCCQEQSTSIDRFDFDVKGFAGSVKFTRLCTDAAEEKDLFAPAEGLKRVDVERDGVFRTVSGTVNFLMEKVQ